MVNNKGNYYLGSFFYDTILYMKLTAELILGALFVVYIVAGIRPPQMVADMIDNGVVSLMAHEKSTINTDNAFVEFPVIK